VDCICGHEPNRHLLLRGVAFDVATLLARHGIAVALSARDQPQARRRCGALSAWGVVVVCVAGDITVESVRERLVRTTLEAFGTLDILISGRCRGCGRACSEMELNFTATSTGRRDEVPIASAAG